jgi:hypothetical protein
MMHFCTIHGGSSLFACKPAFYECCVIATLVSVLQLYLLQQCNFFNQNRVAKDDEYLTKKLPIALTGTMGSKPTGTTIST